MVSSKEAAPEVGQGDRSRDLPLFGAREQNGSSPIDDRARWVFEHPPVLGLDLEIAFDPAVVDALEMVRVLRIEFDDIDIAQEPFGPNAEYPIGKRLSAQSSFEFADGVHEVIPRLLRRFVQCAGDVAPCELELRQHPPRFGRQAQETTAPVCGIRSGPYESACLELARRLDHRGMAQGERFGQVGDGGGFRLGQRIEHRKPAGIERQPVALVDAVALAHDAVADAPQPASHGQFAQLEQNIVAPLSNHCTH